MKETILKILKQTQNKKLKPALIYISHPSSISNSDCAILEFVLTAKQSFIWFPVHQTYWPEQMAVIFTAHTDCVSLVRFHCKHGRWACVLASCHVCAVAMIGKLYCENEELKQKWLQSAWFSRTNIRSNKKYHFQTIQIIYLWIPLLKPDLLDALHITDPLISSSAHSFTLSQLICRQSWKTGDDPVSVFTAKL